MKKVPIHELKRNLAFFVSEAANGERILITRHKKPVAALAFPESEYLFVGAHFGKGRLRPALDHGSHGKFLKVLEDDRRSGARQGG